VSYKIEVDRENCIACGVCYGTDPTHFEGDSEGKSKVIGGKSNGKSVGTFDDGAKDDAQRAADSCPVSVISVT
jgi:ferredoxin